MAKVSSCYMVWRPPTGPPYTLNALKTMHICSPVWPVDPFQPGMPCCIVLDLTKATSGRHPSYTFILLPLTWTAILKEFWRKECLRNGKFWQVTLNQLAHLHHLFLNFKMYLLKGGLVSSHIQAISLFNFFVINNVPGEQKEQIANIDRSRKKTVKLFLKSSVKSAWHVCNSLNRFYGKDQILWVFHSSLNHPWLQTLPHPIRRAPLCLTITLTQLSPEYISSFNSIAKFLLIICHALHIICTPILKCNGVLTD